jgi:hypothetical protein
LTKTTNRIRRESHHRPELYQILSRSTRI